MIEQIEAAETKDELETLGKELGVDVNKREGVETIRAKLLEVAEESAPSYTESTANKTEEGAAPEAEKNAYKGRLLKHRKNGRLFPWTAQLAKKRDMQEV